MEVISEITSMKKKNIWWKLSTAITSIIFMEFMSKNYGSNSRGNSDKTPNKNIDTDTKFRNIEKNINSLSVFFIFRKKEENIESFVHLYILQKEKLVSVILNGSQTVWIYHYYTAIIVRLRLHRRNSV